MNRKPFPTIPIVGGMFNNLLCLVIIVTTILGGGGGLGGPDLGSGFTFVMVENTVNRGKRTSAQNNINLSVPIAKYVKSQGGKRRTIDVSQDPKEMDDWVRNAWQYYKDTHPDQGNQPDWVYVSNGSTTYSGALPPDPNAMLDVLTSYKVK